MNNNSFGEIITFYSYKGGTGRSMALANVGCLLAQKQNIGGNVLMIDWDLEAPGLHQFFRGKFTNNGELEDLPQGQLGLIDLFYDIRDHLENNKLEADNLETIFDLIDIQKYTIKTNFPSLFFMPAGNFQDGMYSTRVNEFDWADFFDKFPSVITQFAQHLREKYKYVLIDSRTGYTDISGICTSIMPEKLVTVFTPNRQSLSGIVELIRRATDYRKQSDDLRPLMIFPLPSRIENAEDVLQKAWRVGNSTLRVEGYQKQLEAVLRDVYSLQECDLTKYFDEYQLQYKAKYSYGEEIAVLSERSEERLSLARSFENFTERIIGSENPWEEIKDSLYEKRKTELDEVSKSESRRKLFVRTISGIFVGAVIVLLYLVFSNLQSLYDFIYTQYLVVLVIIWVVVDLVWIDRWRSLIGRIGKLVAKPWIFKKDEEPNDPRGYPRTFLEQLALRREYESKDGSNDGVYTDWINAQRDRVFDPVNPMRSLGYVISLVFFIFFILADSIAIANTLVIMGTIPLNNLPAILQRLDLAILGGSVLAVVLGTWMLIEMSGKGELISTDLTNSQRQLFKAFAAMVTLLSIVVMLALAIQRLISLGALQSSPTTDLILSFVLYGLLTINISLSASLTFQPAATGLIVSIYLLVFIFPLLAFITDILGRVIYIIVDVALWAILTPIIAIPYGIGRIIGSFNKLSE